MIDQINRFCQNNSKSICLVPSELKLIKNELALELIELLEPFCHGITLIERHGIALVERSLVGGC